MRQFWLLWGRLRGNYWLVPTAIIGTGIGLAYGMLKLDAILPTQYVLHLSWIYTRNATGAWQLLSVTAQSMITVAGVVFSITTVALTFASNQFGTRILRNFIHDTGNQVVFGIFLATFIYCLLVMRRVETGDPGFVPHLSLAVGIFLALCGTFTLVYFIHHVIVSLEAETVVARVASDLRATIENLFPEKLGKDETQTSPEHRSSELPEGFEEGSCTVGSEKLGFITHIDSNRLLAVAKKHDLLIEILARPGEFVFFKLPLAKVWPDDRVGETVAREVRKIFEVARQRTFEQDVALAFQQLVLLTARSLSPGINALGPAMDSINYVAGAFVLLGGRKIPSGRRYDEHDKLRVIAEPWDLQQLADGVFNPMRQAAAQQSSVLNHLIAVMGLAIKHIDNEQLRQRLRHHLKLMELAARDFVQTFDRVQVEKTFSQAAEDEPAA